MRDLEEWTTVKRNLDEYHICGCGLDSSESEQNAVADVRPSHSHIFGQTHAASRESVLGQIVCRNTLVYSGFVFYLHDNQHMHKYKYAQSHIITIQQHVSFTGMTETCCWRKIICDSVYLYMCICWLSYTFFNARIWSAKRVTNSSQFHYIRHTDIIILSKVDIFSSSQIFFAHF